ncbi:Propionyl-CoA:succinate CoA transferase [Jeotgalibaca dankookensis]|uniref:Propionyl-CoA:succinate CoA transferase n=1 Tax=Jeotgalibaca dankookensis TaxID=708126 RepID=A0A1S6IQF3_9LACT|nr:acetyl-CoA hydrolase/transferase C-terminal domain-containing protein [Jeotgalibaca dankookensis]AQS53778.1 Propionyl-CoA:succinate CoA transferase [Jeotgalibaca dankookensis]
MTDYKKLYQEKLTTPERAVQLVEAGEEIVFPINPGEPPALLAAIPTNEKLAGNYLHRMLPSSAPLDIEQDKLQQVSIFLSGADRKYYREGFVDFLPNHFSDIPSLLLKRSPHPVIMATVSPMDKDGNFSLGTSPSYVASLIEHAKTIILEVNENMPRTFGTKNNIHISQVDALVENTVDLPELPTPVLKEKDLAIGKIIADTVSDGATLQIGFGSMPNAVMEYLMDKKDLGIYSEMLPDKLVDLVEKGVVTNKFNPTHPGKTVSTFAIGSKRLYEFMDNNEDILMLPCDETNSLMNIAKVDNLVSINSTVEVDFYGQCNSESVGGVLYSSTGGQADFTKGVRLTKNGRGIICLYSTAKNDEISTIVSELALGSIVSTSKNDIDTVVTEYGKAELIGKTFSERAQALIKIAHPKFRDELRQKAIDKKLINQ